jgi:hypothetical protein
MDGWMENGIRHWHTEKEEEEKENGVGVRGDTKVPMPRGMAAKAVAATRSIEIGGKQKNGELKKSRGKKPRKSKWKDGEKPKKCQGKCSEKPTQKHIKRNETNKEM